MTQLQLNLAARLPVTRLNEKEINGVTCVTWLVDTSYLYGDAIQFDIPAAMSCENAARFELYKYICKNN